MDQEPEMIRHQMEETRTALSNKLEALEHRVVGTVQSATAAVSDTVTSVKDAVTETVETVKGTVGDTVASVKESMDVTRYVDAYPWASFLASVATGFVGGKLFLDRPARRSSNERLFMDDWRRAEYGGERRISGNGYGHDADGRRNGLSAESVKEQAEPGLMDTVMDRFGPEIDKLKGLAVGALMGFARELVTRSVSGGLSGQIESLMDDVTRKIGGQPIQGPLLTDDRRTASSFSR